MQIPQALVLKFVEKCQDIRNASPNLFYAHVDSFCHAVEMIKKPCDHRVKQTPSGYVCVKCGRFA